MDLGIIGSILASIMSQIHIIVLAICGCIIGVLTSFVIINMVREAKLPFDDTAISEKGRAIEGAYSDRTKFTGMNAARTNLTTTNLALENVNKMNVTNANVIAKNTATYAPPNNNLVKTNTANINVKVKTIPNLNSSKITTQRKTSQSLQEVKSQLSDERNIPKKDEDKRQENVVSAQVYKIEKSMDNSNLIKNLSSKISEKIVNQATDEFNFKTPELYQLKDSLVLLSKKLKDIRDKKKKI